ncbi:MAG: hypothetical protein KDA44_07240 [Planctomycetales bacterium]|nr:hypothetical protein [Planctomycetales bacterium]
MASLTMIASSQKKQNEMSVWKNPYCLVLAGCLHATLVGCNSTPGRPEKPDFSPSASAEAAVAEYDADGDGRIDQGEVAACPGLAIAFPRIDTDGDDALDAQEIAARIEHYEAASASLSTGTVMVSLNGQPLPEAAVTFEPEAFLGDSFKACSGETDYTGTAVISGHNDRFPGIFFGLYRVRVSKTVNGKEVVPERFNANTTLGHEASDDIPGLIRAIRFDLRD